MNKRRRFKAKRRRALRRLLTPPGVLSEKLLRSAVLYAHNMLEFHPDAFRLVWP